MSLCIDVRLPYHITVVGEILQCIPGKVPSIEPIIRCELGLHYRVVSRQFAAQKTVASAAVWPKLFFFPCHLIAKSFRNKLGLFLYDLV